MRHFCGSALSAVPEFFQEKKYESPEMNVWIVGVIWHALVSGSLFFLDKILRKWARECEEGNTESLSTYPHFEKLLKHFLLLCVAV